MTPSPEDYNILIVDDENIVISLILDALEDAGYNLFSASNGIDALEIIHENDIDLLVSDIRMSPMDGIELAESAKKFNKNLNVIFMTGYANLNSAKDAIKYGAVDYILKPFELSEIRSAIEKATTSIDITRTEKSSVNQLDRLSDLNQNLYEAGDQESLVTISLRYSILQMNADYGSLLYWDSKKESYNVASITNEITRVSELPSEIMKEIIKSSVLDSLKQPKIIPGIDNHPLFQKLSDCQMKDQIFPWHERLKNSSIAVSMVSNSKNDFGIITVGTKSSARGLRERDLKSLAITASNLALSLDNYFLLEETQQAYSKLKEMQDDTIQLEKMATRGAISSEIGHELNNFVGVVAGNLSLMEHQLSIKNYDNIDKYLRAMTDNIEKIKEFTSNLMNLTPSASNRVTLNFSSMISEIIESLKPQKRFDGVSISLNMPEDAIYLEADNTHIQQLFYNLLNNAADATLEQETREITVTLSLLDHGNRFSITIKDTGVGFEKEKLEIAFREKFTTKETGHGFGLIVCKKIIDNNQGNLKIDSVTGIGTSITVDFPLAETATRTTVNA